jgi:tripartite ATP-independent transporter DctM subunit
LLLIVGVLGSIFTGIATPTEASAVGAFGAMIFTGIHRKLNFSLLKECSNETLKLTAMILWIATTALWLSTVFAGIGGRQFVIDLLQNLGVNRWIVLMGIQVLLIVLGCFMDGTGIIVITVPIFLPVIDALGFDPVWFGVLFIMNTEMGFLTPPYGVNLFYMKGVAPPGIRMTDIYRSIIPFVLLQLAGLIIVMLVPEIALLLPTLIFG